MPSSSIHVVPALQEQWFFVGFYKGTSAAEGVWDVGFRAPGLEEFSRVWPLTFTTPTDPGEKLTGLARDLINR